MNEPTAYLYTSESGIELLTRQPPDRVDDKEIKKWRCTPLYSAPVAEEAPSGMALAMQEAPTIRDAIMRVMRDHYWDSLEPQKELVLKHIGGAMRPLRSV